MSGYSKTWNDDQMTTLLDLWSKGWTGSQIAAVVGVSRSAVLGMARRRGLPNRAASGGKPRSTKSRAAEISALGTAVRKVQVAEAKKKQPKPAPAPRPEPVEPSAKRTTEIVVTEESTVLLSLRRAVRHQTKTEFAVSVIGDPATVGRPMIGAPRSWCRWPIDGDGIALCCAASTSGDGSWCPAHRRIVYASPADRRAAE